MTKLASPVLAILAQDNPTLLEINMAADLTAQKIDQLRQSQELPGHAYGQLFYIANDVARDRASGRVFAMWKHLHSFWDSYAIATSPNPFFGAWPEEALGARPLPPGKYTATVDKVEEKDGTVTTTINKIRPAPGWHEPHQTVVIDSLSQMSEAMAHATARQVAEKSRKPGKTAKAPAPARKVRAS